MEKRRGRHVKVPSAADRWLSVVTSLVALVLGIVLVVSGVQVLPGDVAAARGDGVAGTFVTDERHCYRGGCSWDGSFTSDDGFTVFTDAWLNADAPPDGRGDTVPALWAGDEDGLVYPVGGSHHWLWTVLGIALGAGFVGFGLMTLLAGWFERRR